MDGVCVAVGVGVDVGVKVDKSAVGTAVTRCCATFACAVGAMVAANGATDSLRVWQAASANINMPQKTLFNFVL
jgi:hypothetical protein